MIYFHVNQCLGYQGFDAIEFTLDNIRILSWFFFSFLAMLSNFLIIPVVTEKVKAKLAFAITAGAPATLADEMIQTSPLFALKTFKIFSM